MTTTEAITTKTTSAGNHSGEGGGLLAERDQTAAAQSSSDGREAESPKSANGEEAAAAARKERGQHFSTPPTPATKPAATSMTSDPKTKDTDAMEEVEPGQDAIPFGATTRGIKDNDGHKPEWSISCSSSSVATTTTTDLTMSFTNDSEEDDMSRSEREGDDERPVVVLTGLTRARARGHGSPRKDAVAEAISSAAIRVPVLPMFEEGEDEDHSDNEDLVTLVTRNRQLRTTANSQHVCNWNSKQQREDVLSAGTIGLAGDCAEPASFLVVSRGDADSKSAKQQGCLAARAPVTVLPPAGVATDQVPTRDDRASVADLRRLFEQRGRGRRQREGDGVVLDGSSSSSFAAETATAAASEEGASSQLPVGRYRNWLVECSNVDSGRIRSFIEESLLSRRSSGHGSGSCCDDNSPPEGDSGRRGFGFQEADMETFFRNLRGVIIEERRKRLETLAETRGENRICPGSPVDAKSRTFKLGEREGVSGGGGGGEEEEQEEQQEQETATTSAAVFASPSKGAVWSAPTTTASSITSGKEDEKRKAVLTHATATATATADATTSTASEGNSIHCCDDYDDIMATRAGQYDDDVKRGEVHKKRKRPCKRGKLASRFWTLFSGCFPRGDRRRKREEESTRAKAGEREKLIRPVLGGSRISVPIHDASYT